jgi:hypothetical protein
VETLILTISAVQYDTDMMSQLLTEYLQDSEFAKHFETPKAPYTLRDGHFYRDCRFCVLNGSLRGVFLHDHHNAVAAGHRGAFKTIKALQNQNYWGSHATDVRDYFRTCDPRKSTIYGTVPMLHSTCATQVVVVRTVLDIKFELQETDAGHTGLAVVVDKPSKRAHFLPLEPNVSLDFAYIYSQEIYRHHGLPSKIISDRDARFASKFW